MIFNSVNFGLFLIIVYTVYWTVLKNKLKFQNLFLLISSYVFYGWWDWRFLSLIIISSFIDYTVGLGIERHNEPKKRKSLLCLSIFVNIGLLCAFKYFNFFIDNFVDAFALLNINLNKTTLDIILPVGISFYTFQTLSYSIDIYKGKLKPTKDIVSFFSFVSFFPQLVAGPIERASNLLPQFNKNRKHNTNITIDGLRQILWGLFKKVVIADRCALFVDDIFKNYTEYPSAILLLGAIFFAFQIYGDFSGYSDIAIGTAKLFGFKLKQNFALPYFSRDIAEFWRRWHISLSTWFRDYLYIPLGGSRGSWAVKTRNVFIIFIVSGFWHGANWTFIAWGAINAIYFLPLMFTKRNRKHTKIVAEKHLFPEIKAILKIAFTFFLVVISWVVFRSENIWHAFGFLKNLFATNLQKYPEQFVIFIKELSHSKTTYFIMLLLIIEWLQKEKEHTFDLSNVNFLIRWISYFSISLLIMNFGIRNEIPFIYFQF